jgi:hypothetical protein
MNLKYELELAGILIYPTWHSCHNDCSFHMNFNTKVTYYNFYYKVMWQFIIHIVMYILHQYFITIILCLCVGVDLSIVRKNCKIIV